MKVWIVWIQETDIIGHIFPDKPGRVHYVKGGQKYEGPIKKSEYTILEEVEIAQEEI